MIRKANHNDIDAILKITNACANYMISKGIYQWNDIYPSRSAFENDIKRNELYVLENDSMLIGCIVISTFMDQEYIPVKWLTKNENNIYVHEHDYSKEIHANCLSIPSSVNMEIKDLEKVVRVIKSCFVSVQI